MSKNVLKRIKAKKGRCKMCLFAYCVYYISKKEIWSEEMSYCM